MTAETSLTFASGDDWAETINVLLYGPPGSGKTTAAATAPGPILWLNLQGAGAMGFARKVAAQRETMIAEVRIDRGDDPRKAMRGVIEHVRHGAMPKPQTVVVDTVGDLREALVLAIAKREQPTLPEWGEVGKVLMDFVKLLRDLEVNVVLIAHESVEDSGDQDRIVRPMIGGKSTEQVAAEMDVIAYCGVVTKEGEPPRYIGQLVEGRGRRAKDRSGGLGASRDLDLTEWRDTYVKSLAPDDVPFSPAFEKAAKP